MYKRCTKLGQWCADMCQVSVGFVYEQEKRLCLEIIFLNQNK